MPFLDQTTGTTRAKTTPHRLAFSSLKASRSLCVAAWGPLRPHYPMATLQVGLPPTLQQPTRRNPPQASARSLGRDQQPPIEHLHHLQLKAVNLLQRDAPHLVGLSVCVSSNDSPSPRGSEFGASYPCPKVVAVALVIQQLGCDERPHQHQAVDVEGAGHQIVAPLSKQEGQSGGQ